MALRITFDLEEDDLKYFRKFMRDAKASAKAAPEAEIIAGARTTVEAAKAATLPAFVAPRINRVSRLVDMLEDPEWDLDATGRANVLSALAYFADPTDLIPDEVPVLGYIDDAIMIELVVRELRPEIDAYEDFCKFRASGASKRMENRDAWLKEKRRQLLARMRRRRSAGSRTSRGTRLRLF